MDSEAQISGNKTMLVILSKIEDGSLLDGVCGARIDVDSAASWPSLAKQSVYLCGDISKASELGLTHLLKSAGQVFQRFTEEHGFQSLSESNKPGTAHRTGIYLTPVQQDGADLHFRLLRCSTNLSGSTENFRATDAYVVDTLNREADRIFQRSAPLNHVLAQIYNNAPATETSKQTKAKISVHAADYFPQECNRDWQPVSERL